MAKFWSYFGKFWTLITRFLLLWMGKYWTINLVIWSHWSVVVIIVVDEDDDDCPFSDATKRDDLWWLLQKYLPLISLLFLLLLVPLLQTLLFAPFVHPCLSTYHSFLSAAEGQRPRNYLSCCSCSCFCLDYVRLHTLYFYLRLGTWRVIFFFNIITLFMTLFLSFYCECYSLNLLVRLFLSQFIGTSCSCFCLAYIRLHTLYFYLRLGTWRLIFFFNIITLFMTLFLSLCFSLNLFERLFLLFSSVYAFSTCFSFFLNWFECLF